MNTDIAQACIKKSKDMQRKASRDLGRIAKRDNMHDKEAI